jgi:imidazolonepropionase-like amidohydrolase
MTLLLTGATLIDGTGSPPSNHAVLIEGERITAVGPAEQLAQRAPRAERLDLHGRWLLPGLVNAHDHLCLKEALVNADTVMAYYSIYRQSAHIQVLRGVRGALVSLAQGITAVRDAGAMDQLSLHVKDGINLGILVGPRVFTCGSPLSIPYEGAGVRPAGMTVDAEGEDEIRRVVRDLAQRGADFIKVKGHRRDFSSAERTRLYSREEIGAVVDEAHSLGLPATVHAWHTEIIEYAIEFGADCIEHANPLIQQPTLADRIARAGIALVPNVLSWAPKPEVDPELNKRTGIATEEIWPSTRVAIRAGVKLGVGTDLLTVRMSDELRALIQLGLTPAQAIQAATRNGAEILGQSQSFGTVESGKYADLVVLAADPLADVAALDAPELVFKSGQPFSPGALAQATGPEPLAAD